MFPLQENQSTNKQIQKGFRCRLKQVNWLNRDLDLDLIYYIIRKATPKRFNILSVYKQRDKRYKITITSEEGEEWNRRQEEFIAGWNHEFVHVIISEVVSYKASCKYDDYLIKFGLYNMNSLLDGWL